MGLRQNSLEFHVVLTRNKAELGVPSKLPCQTVKLRVVEGETEVNLCRSSLLFPAGPCGKDAEVMVHIHVLISGSAAKMPFTPAGTGGLNSSALSSDPCTFGFALWWPFVSSWHFSRNRINPMDYCFQNLIFLNALRIIPRGWEPPWQILNTRWCFQGTILGAAAQRVQRHQYRGDLSAIFADVFKISEPWLP